MKIERSWPKQRERNKKMIGLSTVKGFECLYDAHVFQAGDVKRLHGFRDPDAGVLGAGNKGGRMASLDSIPATKILLHQLLS